MNLNYDFDVFSVIPKDIFADPKLGQFLGEMGMKENVMGNKVALFRDPKTVAALQATSPRVIEAFKKAGFGFNVYDSGAGPGRFPTGDFNARAIFLQRLTDALNEEFSEEERKVQKILQAPIPKPTTMLDRLNGSDTHPDFVVSGFMGAALQAQVNMVSPDDKPSSLQNRPATKTSKNSWASNFVSSVLRHQAKRIVFGVVLIVAAKSMSGDFFGLG